MFENWAWLKHKNWTRDAGFHVDKPSWSDLFSTNDVFDPYRFQMVSFSFVIGVSLLMVGLSGLANFTIPESLLGLIGLSQATYIGGKIAVPATFSALDAKLTDLRKAQADFLAATADKWVPLTDPGTQLAAAKADNKAKYVAFQTLVGPAKEMFDELFKVRGDDPNPTWSPAARSAAVHTRRSWAPREPAQPRDQWRRNAARRALPAQRSCWTN